MRFIGVSVWILLLSSGIFSAHAQPQGTTNPVTPAVPTGPPEMTIADLEKVIGPPALFTLDYQNQDSQLVLDDFARQMIGFGLPLIVWGYFPEKVTLSVRQAPVWEVFGATRSWWIPAGWRDNGFPTAAYRQNLPDDPIKLDEPHVRNAYLFLRPRKISSTSSAVVSVHQPQNAQRTSKVEVQCDLWLDPRLASRTLGVNWQTQVAPKAGENTAPPQPERIGLQNTSSPNCYNRLALTMPPATTGATTGTVTGELKGELILSVATEWQEVNLTESKGNVPRLVATDRGRHYVTFQMQQINDNYKVTLHLEPYADIIDVVGLLRARLLDGNGVPLWPLNAQLTVAEGTADVIHYYSRNVPLAGAGGTTKTGEAVRLLCYMPGAIKQLKIPVSLKGLPLPAAVG